jgi:hypothetical protein
MDESFKEALHRVTARLESRKRMGVLLLKNPEYIKDVISLALTSKEEQGLQAAWTLEQSLLLDPLFMAGEIHFFIEHLPKSHPDSTLRSVAKMTSILLQHPLMYEAVMELPNKTKKHLVDCSFRWLIDGYRVAVQVHAMECLSRLIGFSSWIEDDLIDWLEINFSIGSPAFQARARMILERLKK